MPASFDPRVHDEVPTFCGVDQLLHGYLPVLGFRLSFRQGQDVRRGVFQCSKRLALRRRDRIVEAGEPQDTNANSTTERQFLRAAVIRAGIRMQASINALCKKHGSIRFKIVNGIAAGCHGGTV